MTATATPPTQQGQISRSQWRMTLLASLGSGLEFYDFIVYGIFAAQIRAAFFPSANPVTGLILTYSVFAIAYVARPIGGIFLSSLGDRLGRKRIFLLTVVMMSMSLFLMGLLPTYETWGIAAPLALVLLRLVQSFCVGGELPGAITYTVETVPRRAGLVCGIVYVFVNAGVLLATAVDLVLFKSLPEDSFMQYGWRIAFIFGGVLGIVSVWLRRALEETPEFVSMRHLVIESRPVRDVVAHYFTPTVLGFFVCALTAGFNGILFAHTRAYLGVVLGYEGSAPVVAINAALLTMTFVIICVAWLADRIPRYLILRVSSVLLMTVVIPIYWLMAEHRGNLVVLLMLLGGTAAIANGSFACILADLFPARVRFSGIGISMNLSFTFLSGVAPLIATLMINATGWMPAPSLFIFACALMTFICTFRLGPWINQIQKDGNY